MKPTGVILALALLSSGASAATAPADSDIERFAARHADFAPTATVQPAVSAPVVTNRPAARTLPRTTTTPEATAAAERRAAIAVNAPPATTLQPAQVGAGSARVGIAPYSPDTARATLPQTAPHSTGRAARFQTALQSASSVTSSPRVTVTGRTGFFASLGRLFSRPSSSPAHAPVVTLGGSPQIQR